MTNTTNIYLSQPAYNSSRWDLPLNANETILDNQLSGTVSVSLTNTNVTLTVPDSAGGGQTQAMRLVFTGTLSANVTVFLPLLIVSPATAVAGKWIIYNNTTGAYTVTFACGNAATGATAALGTTLTVPQGYNLSVYSDGQNIAQVDSGLLAGGNLSTLTVSGTATFNGNSSFNKLAQFNGSTTTAAALLTNALEPVTISATAATGTINFDVLTQSVLYYTTNSTGNFVVNFRGNGSTPTTFGSLLSTGQAMTAAFLVTNAAKVTTTLSAITIGSPGLFTLSSGSAPVAGTPVTFTGTPPGGVSTSTTYYVVNPSGSTFNVATTLGGTGITTTGSYTANAASAVFGAYFNTSVQVDGTATGVTTKWSGGSAPTFGNASAIDCYVYTIIKTGASTYTVLGNLTQFA